MRVLFETSPVRALSNAQRLPDGRDRPGTAQMLVVLYEPGDPNPTGASGYPTAKPLTHWRAQRDFQQGTVRLSPSIRGPELGPVSLPAGLFEGMPETTLVAIMWRFVADKL